MSSILEKCEQQVKKLSLQDRAVLIKKLIESLDEFEESNLEQLWFKEASRRLQEFKAGNIEARSEAHVFFDARKRLQQIR